MKRLFIITICLLCILLTITGCSDNEASKRNSNQTKTVDEVIDNQIGKEDDKTKPGNNELSQNAGNDDKKNNNTQPEQPKIDVDLTVLSSTMVYSQVYDMMVNPYDYVGKIIKMKGEFTCLRNEAENLYYFMCVITDATACCAQGIEFILEGEHVYPDDYPKPGDEVCVIGEFSLYEEEDYTYCTLKNARLVNS